MADQPPPAAWETVAGGEGGQRAATKPAAPPPSPPQAAPPAGDSSGEIPRAARDPALSRGLPFPRSAYAAIDLGTNNCRLLIARPSGDNFVVVDAFSRVVRLGEGLAQTGKLSQEAMDRTLGALHVCADKLRRRNVQLARSVATEACRRAANGMEFIERVREETGIAFDIITAGEEARLAVLGCHILLEPGIGPALIFDIGGGSTELVLIESGPTVPRILDWVSVPWGVVSLTETFGDEMTGEDDADQAARLVRYENMRAAVRDSFAAFAERVASTRAAGEHGDDGAHPDSSGALRLLGTSGTVTTLASLHLDLLQYDRRAVDGLIVPAASMRDISSRLSAMSPAERRELPCIGRERADLVVAGCAILEAILDLWPAARLGVADRGIREGILRSLITAGGEGERLRAELRLRQHEEVRSL
ncbi:MAG: Ppx/GppA phosphatase family protein [Novosphingobium sp.]